MLGRTLLAFLYRVMHIGINFHSLDHFLKFCEDDTKSLMKLTQVRALVTTKENVLPYIHLNIAVCS